MDVHANDPTATILGFDRLAQLLGSWQKRELHAAGGFPECRGLSTAQLEDLYQDTAVALLSRPYASEEHLRNALRHGIRHRALNMHRDQRRRSQILAEHAPALHRVAEAGQTPPEDAALAQQDRLIAKEFLAELDPLEREVFALGADGLRYRAIATSLAIPINEARAAAKSCERKRARFQLLYETGRLCGYRAATIHALQNGAAAGTLAEATRAHLAACPACAAARPRGAGRASAPGIVGGLLVAGIPAGLQWVRRLSGTGGVAAKASAVVVAALVAGSALHAASPHHRSAAPTGNELAHEPTRQPVPPSITREPAVIRRTGRSSGLPARSARARATHIASPGRPTRANSSTVPPGPSAQAPGPEALAAREFGPEG